MMRALTVTPGKGASVAVREVPAPRRSDDELLVDGLSLGVCGTDKEIASGQYGWAPPGQDYLILGHESLGRVREAPPASDFGAGDLVVGVVRRPDPVPCGACARGEFDMCRNGRYRERGIKELDGYGSEQWTVPAEYAVALDPGLARVGMLMEPTTVVAKAWQQIEAVGGRSYFDPHCVLVTGAGPIGLLAALLGVQRGLDVHVLDRVTDGPKPRLVRELGATYHSSEIDDVTRRLQPDIVVEATGAPPLVFGAMAGTPAYGIVCLTGVSAPYMLKVDAGTVNRDIVLENDVVIGSVNANLHHYRLASEALAKAKPEWLEGLITRRIPLEQAVDAFTADSDDVKIVIDLDH